MPEISTGLIIGGVNILLIYLLIRRVFNDVIAILSALLYFLSLWSGFFTGVYPNSAYLLMIVLLINNFRVSFKVYTFSLFCLIIFVVYPNIGFFPNNPLVNSINAMRGESINAGFSVLSRVIENKYIFYFLRIIEKALVSINPLYYFTNEAAVDGFLVFPPVWFGFIIPFLVGVLSLYKKYKNKIFVSLIGFSSILLLLIISWYGSHTLKRCAKMEITRKFLDVR